MRGTRILLVDEAHSNNVDTELVISAILCRLNGLSDFKLVLMSATLDIATLYRKARDAGISRDAVDHLSMEERTMPVEQLVLPPSTYPRDNLEMAVRAVIQFHNTHQRGLQGHIQGNHPCLCAWKVGDQSGDQDDHRSSE